MNEAHYYNLIQKIMILLLINCVSFNYNQVQCIKNDQDNGKILAQVKYFKNLDFEQIQNLNLVLLPKGQRLINEGSIYLKNNDTLVLSNQFKPQVKGAQLCASISFTDSIHQTGWDKLYIKTYKECNALIQVWSAGFLEGVITQQQIQDFYDNLIELHQSEKQALKNIFDHFDDVEKTIRKKVTNKKLKSIDDNAKFVYWSQIALTQAQTDGLLLGYNSVAKQRLELHDIYLVNGDGQVPEFLQIFKNSKIPGQNLQQEQARQNLIFRRNFRLRQEKMNIRKEFNFIDDLFEQYQTNDPNEIWYKKMQNSHCSAFIKAVQDQNGNYQDLIVSHSTWDDYSEMLRIYKHYDFEFEGPKQNGIQKFDQQVITFSSYPGCLTSTDDFYIIDKRFVVMETTLEILNERIFKNVLKSDKFIPDYMRIMNSNRLASNSYNWAQWLSFLNTGTYNSQWMVVDMYQFKKSMGLQKLQSNTLVIYEQSSDQIVFQDMTPTLQKQTYWASYNVPYFPKIREYSGFQQMDIKFSNGQYNFEKNPRGIIFQQYQQQANNIQSVKKLMQQNDWDPNKKFKDPAFNIPSSAIAARFDIDKNGKNVGAIDAKITNFEMVQQHLSLAISGPTTQNKKPFDWNASLHNDPHRGLPQRYDFGWQEMDPINFIKTTQHQYMLE